jgi:O-antigen/teichoic acid export membrane protein
VLITVIFVKKDIITKAVWLAKFKYLEISREFYNYASPLFVFNSLAIIVAIFDIWLLQHVSGSIQTGFYGIAYSFAAMCFLFTGAMTQIIAREFSKSFAEDDIDNIKNLFKVYTPILYALAAYFGVFLSFQSKALLEIFMGEEFEGAYFALMIMAFYPIHQTYGQLNTSLFLSTDNTRRYRDTCLVSMFIGTVFSYIFVYELQWGAVGFAWKMVLGQLIGVNLQLFYIARFLRVNLIPFLKNQLLVLLFFVMAAYLVSWSPWLISNALMSLVFDGFLYTLLVTIGVIFFPSIVGLTRLQISNSIFLIKRWRD